MHQEVFSQCGTSKITVVEIIKRRFSLSIKGDTICKKCGWISNVYGLCGYRERRLIWPELLSILECGVEEISKLFTGLTGRNTRGIRLFNNFIDSVNIMELPLQNGRYTWSREGGSASRSLLDSFFY